MIKRYVVGILVTTGLCLPCVAHEHRVGSHRSDSRPLYRLVHIHAPKGYAIKDASFTGSGWIVGGLTTGVPTTNTPDGKVATRAYLWHNGHMTLLKQPNWPNAEATDASADGLTVVGTATTIWDGAWLGSATMALLWHNGSVRELRGPKSMPDSTATRIATDGVAYGTCREEDTTDMSRHPKSARCRWAEPDYSPVVIGEPSANDNAPDVSNAGAHAPVDLIRKDHDYTTLIRVKATGRVFDLNSCLVNPRQKIGEAEHIDDRGRIIVTLTNDDYGLLEPVER